MGNPSFLAMSGTTNGGQKQISSILMGFLVGEVPLRGHRVALPVEVEPAIPGARAVLGLCTTTFLMQEGSGHGTHVLSFLETSLIGAYKQEFFQGHPLSFLTQIVVSMVCWSVGFSDMVRLRASHPCI